MTLNPFSLAARAFYVPFKTAIKAAWNAAKADALAEIKAELPGDADMADVEKALAELREPVPVVEEVKRGKKAIAV
jgi:hypothetical protein